MVGVGETHVSNIEGSLTMVVGVVTDEGMVLCPNGHEDAYFAGRRPLDVNEMMSLECTMDLASDAEVFEFECEVCGEEFIVLADEDLDL